MTSDFKTHLYMYRTFLEQNRSSPASDMLPFVEQLKSVQSSLESLKLDMRSISKDVAEIKNARLSVRADPPPPVHIPTMASVTESGVPIPAVYSSYMAGYYGQQPVASPLVPPTALFQPPFLPPSTHADPTFVANTSAGLTFDHTSQPLPPSAMHSSSMALRNALEATQDNVPPHSFQIPLPATNTISSSLNDQSDEKNGASTFSTEGLLSNIPAPIHSAVVTSPEKPSVRNILVAPPANNVVLGGLLKQSPQETKQIPKPEKGVNESLNSSDHYIDDGRDPDPQFQPVIPLPDTVEVVTGEEEEEILFEERSKLFRFADKEWKERGLGVLKILHNVKQGTVRVLMRREQTFKICCNHLINPSIEINNMKDSEKAVIWAAQDFADEELKLESFSAKFKTPEITQAFKAAFEKAKTIVPIKDSTPVKQSTSPVKPVVGGPKMSLSEMFKPAEGSWACDMCLVNNKKEDAQCAACSTPNPNAPKTVESDSSKSAGASAFKFGLGAGSEKAPSSSTFSFGQPATGSSSMFGSVTTSTPAAPPKTTASSLFGNLGSSSSPSTSLFGNSVAPTFSFGSSSVSITPVSSTSGASTLFGKGN